jgi:uncharacterized cupredoxin-like copper-binding protein
MKIRKSLAIIAMSAIAPLALAADYIPYSGDISKNTDWKKMETVTINMEEFFYEPGDLVLKANTPYKLELVNKGEKKHYYTAPEFYKAVATRKVQSRDGEIKMPYLDAVEVLVGGQIDLYIVPVTKGEFPVYCTIDDHRDQGMEGTITVQ